MRTVFLDKDGTIIENVPFNVQTESIVLTPRAGEGLALLHQHGYQLIVVSNQPGVAFGYFAPEALGDVEMAINHLLEPWNLSISRFYYCPHHPAGRVAGFSTACDCRKPMPGLIEQAERELGIDMGESWMIGDILNDVEAGNRAGCRTVLIDNGNETEWIHTPLRRPVFIAPDLLAAGERIVAFSEGESEPHLGRGR